MIGVNLCSDTQKIGGPDAGHSVLNAVPTDSIMVPNNNTKAGWMSWSRNS